MKIRTKLTIQFTGLVALILITLLLSIYGLRGIQNEQDFYRQLAERARLAARLFLEKDALTPEELLVEEDRYLERLPKEIVLIYNQRGDRLVLEGDRPAMLISEAKLAEVRLSNQVRYWQDDYQVVGMAYKDRKGDHLIFVAAIDEYGKRRLMFLRQVMVPAFFVSLILVYFAGSLFSRQALRDIPRIIQQVNAITASNLDQRIRPEGSGRDEISELSLTFNQMLDRLEESFVVQRNFAAHASHEFRTPLSIIIGEIELALSRERSLSDYQQSLRQVLSQAVRLNALSGALLNIAGMNVQEVAMQELRMDELLLEIILHEQRRQPVPDIRFDFGTMPDQPESLVVWGNQPLLYIAIVNILENALKFSDGKAVTCWFEYQPGWLVVAVRDQGIGIPSESLQHITQPLYRSKNALSYAGSGLGLALVEKVLYLHQGRIRFDSVLGQGTTVRMCLPIFRP